MSERLSYEFRKEIIEFQLYECFGCGEHLDYPQVHHIVARWQGGTNGDSDDLNLVALCPNCHVKADNLNVLGEAWGGVLLEDVDPCQVDDFEKYQKALDKVKNNRNNTQLVKKIKKIQ